MPITPRSAATMPHNLQHRDVTIVRDDATGKEILEIGPRQARCRLLQEHAGRSGLLSSPLEARDAGKHRGAGGG
jgi:hypothetical protein